VRHFSTSALDPADVSGARSPGTVPGRQEDAPDRGGELPITSAAGWTGAVATGAPFMSFGIVEERSGVEPFFPADRRGLRAAGAERIRGARLLRSRRHAIRCGRRGQCYGMRRAADAFAMARSTRR
jgi:hypothetical protein